AELSGSDQAERSAGSVYSPATPVPDDPGKGWSAGVVVGRDPLSSFVHWRAFVVSMERRWGPWTGSRNQAPAAPSAIHGERLMMRNIGCLLEWESQRVRELGRQGRLRGCGPRPADARRVRS